MGTRIRRISGDVQRVSPPTIEPGDSRRARRIRRRRSSYLRSVLSLEEAIDPIPATSIPVHEPTMMCRAYEKNPVKSADDALRQAISLHYRTKDKPDKLAVGNQIAHEQAAGLLDHPEKPFHTTFLHPFWRTDSQPGQHIQTPTHTYRHAHTQAIPLFFEEMFLARYPHADEQNVGPARANAIRTSASFILREIAARMFDVQTRKAPPQSLCHFGGRIFSRPQEIDSLALVCCTLAECVDQVDTRYAFGQGLPEPAGAPDERQAVRHGKRRAVDEFLQARVSLHHHQNRNVNRTQPAALPCAQQAKDGIDGLWQGQWIKLAVQNTDSLHHMSPVYAAASRPRRISPANWEN